MTYPCHLQDDGIFKRLCDDVHPMHFDWTLRFLNGDIVPTDSHLYCVLTYYAYEIIMCDKWDSDDAMLYDANRLLETLVEAETEESADCHCDMINQVRAYIDSTEAELIATAGDYDEWLAEMNYKRKIAS